ncbi:hypothetical protein [Insolitispirillum peregrinum]|uniref:Uncharacterized protein n=1 Tax=Insolitispirillum peregrinum TaxID=80876 RepID=A0A1N7MGT5_9PROT|nr:hypothetical protein [Insolitispirillum peregrinum]SIS85267.1 hypothetical protein SAMN05421779_104112 [Insolitispirillum peregrinum]
MKDQQKLSPHDLVAAVAALTATTAITFLAPVASVVFNTSLGLSSFLMMGLLPTRFSSLFWLRKGAVLTSLIALFWYQQARQVSGLSDNGFFCLLSSSAPVPAELWVSLAFAVIAGAQAALAVLTLVSALPLKRKD